MIHSMNGADFRVGQRVLKAKTFGRSAQIEERVVARIDGHKIFLDGDKLVALRFPERVWVLD